MKLTIQQDLDLLKQQQSILKDKIWNLERLKLQEKIADAEIGTIYDVGEVKDLYWVSVDTGSEGFGFILQTKSEERAELIVSKLIEDNLEDWNLEEGYGVDVTKIEHYYLNLLIDQDYQEGVSDDSNILYMDSKDRVISNKKWASLFKKH